MSMQLATIASDKDILLARSALCRLRLRHQVHNLRAPFHGNPVNIAAAGAPMINRMVLGAAISFAGFGRTARFVRLAARILLVAKLARAVIAGARGRARPSGRDAMCDTAQTAFAGADSLARSASEGSSPVNDH